MAFHVPDHNDPEVKVSEIKAFTQRYYIVDDDGETGRRTDYELRDARVEVTADDDGVFLECREGGVTEALSIPTPDLAVSVANYILEAYIIKDAKNTEDSESFSIEQILFLEPEVQKRISHELWRLFNHITSPHGPVDAQGAGELYGHLKYLARLLDLPMEPHPKYSDGGYKPNYTK
jgi:hypothetical protein